MPRFRLQDDDFTDHVSSTRFCLDDNDFPQELVPRLQWTKQASYTDPAMDRLTQLLEAATLVDEAAAPPPPLQIEYQTSRSVPNQERAAAEMKVLREKTTAENKSFEANLRLLIETTERKAEAVREEAIRKQQEQEEQQRAAEKKAQDEATKKRAEYEAKAAADAASAVASSDSIGISQEETNVAISDDASPTLQPAQDDQGDVHEAKKLVKMLVDFQASAKTFESSSDQSDKKRRLQFKKLANGKLNTLAENVQKIQSVAVEVVAAIIQAENDDKTNNAKGKEYLLDLISVNVMTRAQADGFNGLRGDGFPLAAMLAMIGNEYPSFNKIFMAHVYTACPVAIPEFPNSSDGSDESFMKSLGMKRTSDGEFESFDKFISRTEGIISLMGEIIASHPSTHTLFGGNVGGLRWLEHFIDILPKSSSLPVLTAPVLDAFLTATGHMLACHHAEAFRKLLQKVDSLVPRLDDTPIGTPSATRLKKTIEGGFDKFRQTVPNRALPDLYYGTSSGPPAHAPQSTGASPFGSNPMTQASPFGAQTSPFGVQSSPFGVPAQGNPSTFGNNKAAAPSGKASCKFFAQGNCRFGDRCKFSHEDSGTTQSSSQFGNSNQAGTNNSKSPFGASSTSQSPFGGAPSASPFGAAPSASPFGTSQPNQTAFGAAQASNTAAPAPFGSNPSPFSSTTQTTPSPFGSAQSGGFGAAQGSTSGPFAAPSNTSTFGQSPFGAGNTASSPFGGGNTSSQFGANTSAFGSNPNSSPFGAVPNTSAFGSGMAASPSPFGNSSNTSQFNSGAASAPFGSAPNTSIFGGGLAPSATPFSSGPSPFGAPAPSTSGFGSSNNNPGFGLAPSPSPFGAPAQNATPFGGSSGATTFGAAASPSPFGVAASPSPFGGPTASSFGAAPNPSPFGGAAPSPSPFGVAAPSPSPFGVNASSPSPFGGAAPSPSPFGVVAASPSPFGGAAPSPSPFGVVAASPSPFGGPAQATSAFGGGAAPNPSPFGASAPSQSPFGGPSTTMFGGAAPSPTPFGSVNSSPFGSGPGPTAFGGGAMQSSFGQNTGGGTKPPCKFFAQGRCSYGDKCRFSHENAQNSGFNAPFGGPRR